MCRDMSRSPLVGGPYADAAARRCRVKVCTQPRLAQTLQDTLQQMEVHAADQAGVLLGKRVERAVVQDYVTARELWLEAVGLEQAH